MFDISRKDAFSYSKRNDPAKDEVAGNRTEQDLKPKDLDQAKLSDMRNFGGNNQLSYSVDTSEDSSSENSIILVILIGAIIVIFISILVACIQQRNQDESKLKKEKKKQELKGKDITYEDMRKHHHQKT